MSAIVLEPDGTFAAGGPNATLTTPARAATFVFAGRFVSAQRVDGRFELTATPFENPRTCKTNVTWSATTG